MEATDIQSPSRPGFTLIELIAVVGIVAVILAIALPALARSRRAAQSVACLNNLRSLGQAITMYRIDNDDLLPFADRAADVRLDWSAPFDALEEYVDAPPPRLNERGDVLTGPPYACPADSTESTVLGVSYFYTPMDIMGLWPASFAQRAATLWLERDPSVILMLDLGAYHEPGSSTGTGCNALLFDGSARPADSTLSVNPR